MAYGTPGGDTMAAAVINLKRARKARARREREADAVVQRDKFGRSRAERDQASATRALDVRRLDGAQISRPAQSSSSPETPPETDEQA